MNAKRVFIYVLACIGYHGVLFYPLKLNSAASLARTEASEPKYLIIQSNALVDGALVNTAVKLIDKESLSGKTYDELCRYAFNKGLPAAFVLALCREPESHNVVHVFDFYSLLRKPSSRTKKDFEDRDKTREACRRRLKRKLPDAQFLAVDFALIDQDYSHMKETLHAREIKISGDLYDRVIYKNVDAFSLLARIQFMNDIRAWRVLTHLIPCSLEQIDENELKKSEKYERLARHGRFLLEHYVKECPNNKGAQGDLMFFNMLQQLHRVYFPSRPSVPSYEALFGAVADESFDKLLRQGVLIVDAASK